MPSQRRVHLEVRVVGVGDVILAEEQVVRRHLAGHAQSVRFGSTHELEALGRGDVTDMQGAACRARKLDIAIDLQLLGKGRPAEHAKSGGSAAGVDHALAREAFDLAVGAHDPIELAHIRHACLHHAGALYAMPVVRERRGTLHHHVANLGQGFALLIARKRTHGPHVHQTHAMRGVDLIAHLSTRVGDGIGIGHGGHIGKASMCCRARTRLDGLLVLEARITEVYVHVDETRHQVLACCVDDNRSLRRLECVAHLRNLLALDENVLHLVKPDLRVYEVCPLNQICHCALLPAADTSRPCASQPQPSPGPGSSTVRNRQLPRRSPCHGSSGRGGK